MFNIAATLLMEKESDRSVGTVCHCGERTREVRCVDCDQRELLCRQCWIVAHKHSPLHWAEVWNADRGYFTHQDISTVLTEGYAIPLGHSGNPCRQASKPLFMTIGECNGVHATKVTFCHCEGSASKWHQLFAANLLPATVNDPQTMFTFRVLRHWQIQTLQSNITGYDYVHSLRRMTDNVFTGNIPVSSIIIYPYSCVNSIWSLGFL